MDASDVIAVSSTFVALGALVLTGYIARVNLEHQRVEAHRGRVWERKVDVILEFLEWVEMDAADGRPIDNADDPLQQAPRIPTSLHSRLTAFVPEFGQEIAAARLAVGKWRHVGALYREGRASQADLENAMNDVGVRLEHLRGLAKNEVREVPYFA